MLMIPTLLTVPRSFLLSSWSSFITTFDNLVLDTQPATSGTWGDFLWLWRSLQGCWNVWELEVLTTKIGFMDFTGSMAATWDLPFKYPLWTVGEQNGRPGWLAPTTCNGFFIRRKLKDRGGPATTSLSGTVFYHASATMLIPRMVNKVAQIGFQWPYLPMFAAWYSPWLPIILNPWCLIISWSMWKNVVNLWRAIKMDGSKIHTVIHNPNRLSLELSMDWFSEKLWIFLWNMGL